MAEKVTSREILARNLRSLRKKHGISQERLAELAGLHRTYVSSVERSERNISVDNIEILARALFVQAVDLITNHESESGLDDRALMESIFPSVRRYQQLATKHGIGDIFQDNGGKLLQMIFITGLRVLTGREGNDAVDTMGNVYELKSVNRSLTGSYSTHHHLNPTIIKKYRSVDWYFAVYEGIELIELYFVKSAALEPYFQKWARKWESDGNKDINNRKIPLAFIKRVGNLVYEANAVTAQLVGKAIAPRIADIEELEG